MRLFSSEIEDSTITQTAFLSMVQMMDLVSDDVTIYNNVSPSASKCVNLEEMACLSVLCSTEML
jgi:hypothetical protein